MQILEGGDGIVDIYEISNILLSHKKYLKDLALNYIQSYSFLFL